MTPKHITASALTLLLMAADTMTVGTRPASNPRDHTLEQVAAYAASLGTGKTAMHTLAFERGREYHVEAACTDGCTVDMQLYSSTGREIDRHVGGAGTAEVALVTSNTGNYRASVTMVACRVQPCAYTLAVFAR
jgi:hypothetical protein